MIYKGYFIGHISRGNRVQRRKVGKCCFLKKKRLSKAKRYWQASFHKRAGSRKQRLLRHWRLFVGRWYWVNIEEFENIRSAHFNEIARILGFKSFRQCFSKRNRFVLRKGVLNRRWTLAFEIVPITIHRVKKWVKIDGIFYLDWGHVVECDWSVVKDLKIGRVGQY